MIRLVLSLLFVGVGLGWVGGSAPARCTRTSLCSALPCLYPPSLSGVQWVFVSGLEKLRAGLVWFGLGRSGQVIHTCIAWCFSRPLGLGWVCFAFLSTCSDLGVPQLDVPAGRIRANTTACIWGHAWHCDPDLGLRLGILGFCVHACTAHR